MTFGRYPTPVQQLAPFSTARTSLWIKRDDLTHPLYGGNKVRKLERLLDDAEKRGAEEIVTVGAAGSNHVLTTGVFARERGMRVTAILVPQPRSAHVVDNLRAALAQGVRVVPAASRASAAVKLAARVAGGAYYIPAGGSNPLGVSGFVDAGLELAAQVRAGELPAPELIVVALGSGGTVAGLLAGVARAGLATRVLGVTVAAPPWFVEYEARSLAIRCGEGALSREDVARRLEHERRYLGRGYGHATEATTRAHALAARAELALEQTYTAKAFAAALERVEAGRERTILYWHTSSSAPMAPLLAGAPAVETLEPALRRLLREP